MVSKVLWKLMINCSKNLVLHLVHKKWFYRLKVLVSVKHCRAGVVWHWSLSDCCRDLGVSCDELPLCGLWWKWCL